MDVEAQSVGSKKKVSRLNLKTLLSRRENRPDFTTIRTVLHANYPLHRNIIKEISKIKAPFLNTSKSAESSKISIYLKLLHPLSHMHLLLLPPVIWHQTEADGQLYKTVIAHFWKETSL